MTLIALALPLLLQVGPDPSRGGIPDYSGEIQDRPARSEARIDAPRADSWLARCLETLDEDPSRAHVQAQIRRDTTAGEERVIANHCLGLAATRLERWEEARAAFSAAGQETASEDRRLRARFAAMAANAALVTGDVSGALDLLEQAQADALAANAGSLQALIALDRARALVAAGQYDAALASLDEAARLRPEDAEARLLSATLLRRMERLGEAQQQIEHAARLDPFDPAIALEAGVIAMLGGRENAARASWQSAMSLAPGSPEARTAQSYLDQLGPPAAPDGEDHPADSAGSATAPEGANP